MVEGCGMKIRRIVIVILPTEGQKQTETKSITALAKVLALSVYIYTGMQILYQEPEKKKNK